MCDFYRRFRSHPPTGNPVGHHEADVLPGGLHHRVGRAAHRDRVGCSRAAGADNDVQKVGHDRPQVDGLCRGLAVQSGHDGRAAQRLRRKGGNADLGEALDDDRVEGLARNVGQGQPRGQDEGREAWVEDWARGRVEPDRLQGRHLPRGGAERRCVIAAELPLSVEPKTEHAAVAASDAGVEGACGQAHEMDRVVAEGDQGLVLKGRAAAARDIDHRVAPESAVDGRAEADRRARREQD